VRRISWVRTTCRPSGLLRLLGLQADEVVDRVERTALLAPQQQLPGERGAV
jgi:hypothetical protein